MASYGKQLGRIEDALVCYRAVGSATGSAEARFGESLALLASGSLREGWEAYESRL